MILVPSLPLVEENLNELRAPDLHVSMAGPLTWEDLPPPLDEYINRQSSFELNNNFYFFYRYELRCHIKRDLRR